MTFLSRLGFNRKGVIGLNERNVRYVLPLNHRKRIRAVDDKIETKRLATAVGIPVPTLYGEIGNAFQMRALDAITDHADGFVVKPSNGSQGNGIMVIAGRMSGSWQTTGGRRVTRNDMRFHINNVISGMYSLGGQPDRAMFEYRVKFDTRFDDISFRGVPDIRIIVVMGTPVAAMLRLPTEESDGKANIHKGGVGVGVNLVTGRTLRGMQHGQPINEHPDTGHQLSAIEIPHWQDMLTIAARSFEITQLGYLGVDLVLDQELGPLLLELNARPGIGIQTALNRGLGPVLSRAYAEYDPGRDVAGRIELGQRIFAETANV